MKLTPEQIERLYQFTRQHFVEWYDLQTELVDHLANAIEEQWQENPKLDFEEVLQKEFKKFGVFGFMDVVEKRQASLSKKYNLLIWKHFKAFFGIPKIILTMFLITVLFYFFKAFFFRELFAILMIILFITICPFIYIENRKIKKKKKETGKVWLFEQIIFSYGAFSGIISLPIQMLNIFSTNSNTIPNDYILLLLSVIIVSFYLVSYIVIKIIPSKAEQYLKETYPEYGLET